MTRKWYILRVKRHKERFVRQQLQAAGFATICPATEIGSTHAWEKNIRECFRGYLFVCADAEHDQLAALNWIQGAIGLVAAGDRPVIVSDKVIAFLQKAIRIDGHVFAVEDETLQALFALLS